MKKMRYILIVFVAALAALGVYKREAITEVVSKDSAADTSMLYATKALQEKSKDKHQFSRMHRLWVDSVFKTLTLDQRIGQLFMIRAHSNKDEAYYSMVEDQIEKYGVGGLCFFQGDPITQAKLTNRYQKTSKVPLLISIDGEWGLSMRLKGVTRFPRQMTLGAIQNDTLIYEMATIMAKQFKRVGVNYNLAPVVDINSNAKNPVINSRSFGENRENVARKALMYMRGLQDNGVMASAKHFPGHGDTDQDSHVTLPVINHTKKYMDSVDLYPFKVLADNDVASVMVAHLHIPAYDKRKDIASTLSEHIVNGILKEKLKYKGLAITDALEMKGVSSYHEAGEIELQALKAGNDILLLPTNIEKAIVKIKAAIKTGGLSVDTINNRCKKILYWKYMSGLSDFKPIAMKNMYADINSKEADAINHKLIEASLTVARNNDSLLPLRNLDTLKIASVAVGESSLNKFQKGMEKYADVTFFQIDKKPTKYQREKLIGELKDYNLVIVSFHNTSNSAYKKFGISQEALDFASELGEKKKVILDIFANPYSLERIKTTDPINSVIVSYQDDNLTQDKSAQLIFGGIPAKGKLPVTSSSEFRSGIGFETQAIRLHYTMPEAIGIESDSLAYIDNLIDSCIKQRILPGCQIIAAHKGDVFFAKSYGYHTYKKARKVKLDDIYDLASLTKIFATTPIIMNLYEQGKIDLDAKMSKYLPALKGTNKEDIVIRDVLAHQGQLKAWIPYYLETIKNGQPDQAYYSKTKSGSKNVRVAQNLYVGKSYKDTIFKKILDSELRAHKKYKYSDLGYYLWVDILQKLTASKYEEYVKETYYKPLGLATMGYHPRKRFSLNRITPSERDMVWRKQDVHGDVNDQGSALLGGVCGHAGLFSNAHDAAVITQLFLNDGVYGGKRYFKKETIEEFTKYQFPDNGNRRGLGFDKPIATVEKRNGQTPPSASTKSFGHSGFTGTLVWADPEYDLVYVFLSNRTYPNTKPNLLSKLDIRSRIQQRFYEAIEQLREKDNS